MSLSVNAGVPDEPVATGIARAFVTARAEARVLSNFPGPLPADLDDAYAVQEEVLRLTGRRLAGWKVAGIPPAFRTQYDAERLVGPIFADNVQEVPGGARATVKVHIGGFCAVEAEFVVRLVADVRRDADEAAIAKLARLHVGAEVASSPFAGINDLGPGSVISDHGNQSGAVVGPEVSPEMFGKWDQLVSRTFVNGTLAGEGSAARVAGGPFASAAFLVRQLASRGRQLKAGDIILTGMTTGIHAVSEGDVIRYEFPDIGDFTLDVAARGPKSVGRR